MEMKRSKRKLKAPIKFLSDKVTDALNEAQDCITDEIMKDGLSPSLALGAVAGHAHYHLTGQMEISDFELAQLMSILLIQWKRGKWIPNAQYPFTLQQTLDFAASLEKL
jgi:hypothetical protein